MNKYICECCGGQINRATMKCEYCGTAYREDSDAVIRVETFSNPVRKYTASIVIPNEIVFGLGEKETAHMVTERLVGKLADAIKENMVMYVEQDPVNYAHRIRGYVKIVHPVQVSDMERMR